jgi:hypothetical protein
VTLALLAGMAGVTDAVMDAAERGEGTA